MFGFGRKKQAAGRKSYSYTLPIIEDGQVTGCFMCRSDEQPPEMDMQEFLDLMEGRHKGERGEE